jgi:hypothetical protein
MRSVVALMFDQVTLLLPAILVCLAIPVLYSVYSVEDTEQLPNTLQVLKGHDTHQS